MTKYDVYKNVHIINIDTSDSSPLMMHEIAEWALKNNGNYLYTDKEQTVLMFFSHDDITEFLNDLGKRSRAVEVTIHV